MCTPQIAAAKETQREQFDHIRWLKHVSIVNNFVMAFEYLFGCWHRKLSRPFTLSGWTYEVCLNCGKKLAYNRTDIGCGVAKTEGVGYSRASWHQNHATVSLLEAATTVSVSNPLNPGPGRNDKDVKFCPDHLGVTGDRLAAAVSFGKS